MKSDDEIIRMHKKQYGSAVKDGSKQQTNTNDCQAFYTGDFMSYTDRLQFADGRGNKKATIVQFNKVKPYVNAVRGFMAQNRRRISYTARHQNDQAQELYSKMCNALSDYVRDQCNAEQIETQQDGDMLICGYGAVETDITYGDGHTTTNPNGEITKARVDPRSVYWDRGARSPGLLDARFCGYRKIFEIGDALELYDKSSPEDFERVKDEGAGNKVYYKRGGTYNKIQELYDVAEGDEEKVYVYCHQWYEIEPFYRAKNPLYEMQDQELAQFAAMTMKQIADEQEDSEDEFALDPQAKIISCDKDTMKKLKAFFEDGIDFEKFKRRCYYTAILSGEEVFKKFKNICQSGFSIKFKTGDYDETNKMWVGMVNSLRDPALYYNKALTELLWVVASQAKGGVMAEESAIEDIASFEAKYAKTDGVAIVADGALEHGRVKPKKEGYQPTGIEEIIQAANESLPEVSGIDKTFLGSSENKQEPAALQRQRIKQVTNTLATYFDSITLYQKEDARMMLPYMKVYAENNDGSLFKALDEQGATAYLTLSKQNFTDEYDIDLQEAPDTATQKQESGQALMALAQMLMANPQSFGAGLQALSVAVKLMPIDFMDRQTIIQALMPQDGQINPQYVKQLEMQVHQLMDEGRKAEVADKVASAHKKMMESERIITEIGQGKADTAKIKAETRQYDIENQMLRNQPKNEEVRVNA